MMETTKVLNWNLHSAFICMEVVVPLVLAG